MVTNRDRDSVNGLNDTQWRQLLTLLNANNTSNSNNAEKLSGMNSLSYWILDTGATHHITGRYDILTDVKDMAPVMIILADGRQRISVKEGSVRLESHLVLKSVFYVEEMKSDLISLGQLMDEN